MGKTIEMIAAGRNHQIIHKIGTANRAEFLELKKGAVDVAIDFSHPDIAFENIKVCMAKGIPVVCGTTGWLERRAEVEKLCRETGGAFFWSSNYTLGVNIFFKLNRMLAGIMKNFPSYNVSMEEIHHVQKVDAPSGTAITLAEGVLENIPVKKRWVNKEAATEEELTIISKRIADEPGTHSVFYTSPIDTIEIKHTAHTREGFAEGAVVAAEWLIGRKGIFGMDDLLKIEG